MALIFVARNVPWYDRCVDGAPSTDRQTWSLVREEDGCQARRPQGTVHLTRQACASLQCTPGLRSTLVGARTDVLVGLAVVYLLATASWALRWHRLLSLGGADLPFRTVWRLTLQGMAGSVFLPGAIGGDALRVAFALGRGAAPVIVVATVLLDRVVGLVTLAAVASALSFACSGLQAGAVTWILSLLPAAFAIGMWIARSPQIARWRQPTWGWWVRLVHPVFDYITDKRAPRALLEGILASTVLSVVNLVAIRVIVFALGVTPTEERWIFVGAAMAFIIEAIPALPGGWGTADAAFVVFLARAGLPPSTALAVSLLYRLLNYTSALVGAVLYLAHGRQRAAEPREEGSPPVGVSRAPSGVSH